MLIRYQGTENDGQISWSDQLVTLNDGIKCLCGRTIPFRLVESATVRVGNKRRPIATPMSGKKPTCIVLNPYSYRF